MRSRIYAVGLILLLGATTAVVLRDPYCRSLRTFASASAKIHERGLFADSLEELKYGAIGGVVSILDDYSTWHDRASDTTIRREARGHYGGFGIEIVSFDDTTTIWQVFPESPALEVGMRVGDRLLRADTVSLVGLSLDSVHRTLMLLPLAEVPLTIYRPGEPEPFVLVCGRADIEVGTVTVLGRRGEIAALTVGAFNGRTAGALARALDTLRSQGVRGFIIDLRSNPGGLLQAAVDCAKLFLPREGVIASVTGVLPTEEIRAPQGPYATEPLVILLNDRSASGSELLAGCLQDWDRAVLVGTPTFGKGFVQNLYALRGGSSLRLTVGRYTTPSGRTFYRPDTTRTGDTTHFQSLVHGRPLVGGGRIFPDVEVPELDCPDHLIRLFRGRALFDFAVGLLAADTLPRLDSQLVARAWSGRLQERYSPVIAGLLDSLTPDAARNRAWSERLARLERAEQEFDHAHSYNCLLNVLARHLARSREDVPFLEKPLLETDPALSEAVAILSQPALYTSLLRGEPR